MLYKLTCYIVIYILVLSFLCKSTYKILICILYHKWVNRAFNSVRHVKAASPWSDIELIQPDLGLITLIYTRYTSLNALRFTMNQDRPI